MGLQKQVCVSVVTTIASDVGHPEAKGERPRLFGRVSPFENIPREQGLCPARELYWGFEYICRLEMNERATINYQQV